MSTWDSATWDAVDAEWRGTPPPSGAAGWGGDWAWWYQVGTVKLYDLTELVVEAVWSTDSHSYGDGTFRGDIQPGTLTVRLWDPHHIFDTPDRRGAIFAAYLPTGACWCWFYESVTRGLFAPGDPIDADCVYIGSTWAARMANPNPAAGYPAQSVSARLAAVVATLASTTSGINLPPITASVASQNQRVVALAADANGLYQGWLQTVRDAAAPGVAWLSAVTVNPGDAAAGGRLVLNYARWETTNARTLDRSQVIAGPPVTDSQEWAITQVTWAATNGTTAAQTALAVYSGFLGISGAQGPTGLRLWGDVSAAGAEHAAANATAGQLINDRAQTDREHLSNVTVQSGRRRAAGGGPALADWDPYSHTFAPTDVLALNDAGGTPRYYRVTKSDHRLTASTWQTVHTLETFTAPTPLPA